MPRSHHLRRPAALALALALAGPPAAAAPARPFQSTFWRALCERAPVLAAVLPFCVEKAGPSADPDGRPAEAPPIPLAPRLGGKAGPSPDPHGRPAEAPPTPPWPPMTADEGPSPDPDGRP